MATATLYRKSGAEAGTIELPDGLFAAPDKIEGWEEEDVTGLVGQYAHGNQPIQHMVYLYDHIGQPWKAQSRLRLVMDKLYQATPDGLCGDEDTGQMSAWYVMSAIGLYPFCPGKPEYAIGSPLFSKATLKLAGGKAFSIIAVCVK